MLTCGKWPIGVCGTSWGGMPLDRIRDAIASMGIDGIQLSLGPALEDTPEGHAYFEYAAQAGWRIFSTVIGFWWEDYSSRPNLRKTAGLLPDEHWEEAKSHFVRYAKMTKDLKSPFILFHAGFLEKAVPGRFEKMSYRLKTFADIAGENGIGILLETGQESAEDLRAYIEHIDHPALQVNLDPANLLSYHKDDPYNALEILAPWVKSIHAKDTIPFDDPDRGGVEQVWGDGVVNGYRFLNALEAAGFDGTVSIEREGGANRLRDIATAVRRLSAFK